MNPWEQRKLNKVSDSPAIEETERTLIGLNEPLLEAFQTGVPLFERARIPNLVGMTSYDYLGQRPKIFSTKLKKEKTVTNCLKYKVRIDGRDPVVPRRHK